MKKPSRGSGRDAKYRHLFRRDEARNTGRLSEIEKDITWLSTLNEIGRAAASGLELQPMLATVYDRINKVLKASNLLIATLDSTGNSWTMQFKMDRGERGAIESHPMSYGLTGYVMRSRKGLLLETIAEKAALLAREDIAPGLPQAKSWMGVPLIASGVLMGAIAVQDYEAEHAYSGEDIELFVTIASQIASSIQNARRFQAAQQALRESEAEYRGLVDTAIEGIYRTSLAGKSLTANPALARILGYDSAEAVLNNVQDSAHQVWAEPEERSQFIRLVQEQGIVRGYECQFVRADGQKIWVSLNGEAIRGPDGLIAYIQGFVTDITDRKRATQALEKSEERMRLFFERQLVGMAIADPDKRWVQVNNRLSQILQYSREELLQLGWLKLTHPDDLESDVRQWDRMVSGEIDEYSMEKRFFRKDGQIVHANLFVVYVRRPERSADYVLGITEDITERKRAEEALRQAQKMETVGQLAGGVAHDFNNMLQVISSYSEMSLKKVEAGEPLHKYLLEIRRAAQRSAEITSQLLAFARKQTVSPRVVDLNEAVAKSKKMIQRLIGEDIELAWLPGYDLWAVKVDPMQLDQILANLAANARDAIGGVGKLTIETEKVTFDEEYCAAHADFLCGEYVLLAVSDTGHGMDKQTMSHLFEPFFTTKEPGKGTGLGLATIYGIVKQNNGFINVYSRPGEGTTFRVYLPRAEGTTASEAKAVEEAPLRGTETVLMVDDEMSILELAKECLEQLGYRVLTAKSPEEAITKVDEQAESIDLLITDVVMPQMNGRQLAARLNVARPTLKCLYMSGYTADIIAARGVIEEGVNLLTKPFSLATLAEKVRAVLDG